MSDGMWPDWCAESPWLASFLSTVEEEAREQGHRSIEDFHVMLALTRDEAVAQDLLQSLGLDPRRLRDRLNVRLGLNAGVLMERSGQTSTKAIGATLDELYWRGPLGLTSQITDTLAAARAEADKHGASVGPGHVLAGLSRRGRPLGVGRARIRRAAGIPHEPRVLAVGVDRSTIRRPRALTPLVLGGGDELATAAAALLRLANERRSGRSGAALVVALFAAAASAHDSLAVEARARLLRPFVEAGADAIDSGLSTRADAEDPDVLERLSRADLIYLSGGRPELLLDAVLGTAAYDALVDASENGTIIVGSSAGSMVMGNGMLSDFESDDEEEPLSLFHWIDQTVVVAHYMNGMEPVLRKIVSSFPGSQIIGVAHQGAVLVEPGWRSIRNLVTGVDGGSVILRRVDVELDPIV